MVLWAVSAASVLLACSRPTRLIPAAEPAPAPLQVTSDETGTISVIAFTTSVAPDRGLGGHFDDDGPLKVKEHVYRMVPWTADHRCAVRRTLLAVLQDAGYSAYQGPGCHRPEGLNMGPTRTDFMLAGRLDELTANSYSDPMRMDVEVVVSWELYESDGEKSRFRETTYGSVSQSGTAPFLLGAAMHEAVRESLRRLLANPEFVQVLASQDP